MADIPKKATAQSFSAGLNTETGMSPLHWSDKCFLCSQEIGETDQRQFYQGKAAMMLCHTGCLHTMNAHGGKPADYHRAMSSQPAKAVGLEDNTYTGPGWLDFPDLAALQAYTKDKGDIPPHIKVTVARAVIQAGE